MTGIFRAYDIRGAYPDELDETIARRIGAAFAELLHAGTCVIGRDMRLSSPALAEAFTGGYLAAGGSVTDIGMTSSPLLYYAIITGNFDGGAMITASHLPGTMNGIKLCRDKAIPLSGDEGLPALERRVADMPVCPQKPERPGSYRNADMMESYIDTLSGFVHNPKPVRVAVDAGDGMAGPEVDRLFRRFPSWSLLPLYFGPDGNFPHHGANPFIPSATRQLQECVREKGAALGVAFDGDADRCIVIDEEGERIPSDLVTALIAEFFLTKKPGATILYDLRSSRVVAETITRLGGRAVRCRVGHAFIKEQMRLEDALFAGELSGHYYFRDTGYCDNGIFTLIQMLNLLSIKDEPLSHLIKPLKKYCATGEVNIRISNHGAIMTALESAFHDAEKDYLDGLTVDYASWWFNLRSSNTEPVMRLNLETRDAAEMERRMSEVLRIIRTADPMMHIETG